MKLKKVEISAFRIYEDPKHATFDFVSRTGEVANFISLYAPNGFGKTSFYDAVEWGMTKSVNRFYIRAKELEKLADYQLGENDVPLIRNTKSKLNTIVKIFTDKEDEPIVSNFKKHGRQKHDLNFKEEIVHDFQSVILSQEWISAFLTESDGEERYKKFVRNPKLATISRYYSNLKFQLSACNEKLEEIQEKINDLEKLIKNEGSIDLLLNINSQIELLSKEFGQQSLTPFTLQTTREEVKNLRDYISGAQVSIESKIKSNELIIDDITTARIGGDGITGMDQFFKDSENLIRTKVNLDEIRSKLLKITELESNREKLNNFSQELAEKTIRLNELNEVIEAFPEYQHTKDAIDQRLATIKLAKDTVAAYLLQEEDLRKEERSLKGKINGEIEKILNLENSNANVPEIENSLAGLSLSVSSSESTLKIEKSKLDKRSFDLAIIKDEILQTQRALDDIKLKIYHPELLQNREDLTNCINEITVDRHKIVSLNEQLILIDSIIKEQQKLNSSIEDFIKKGIQIVHSTQQSSCPLCETNFSSAISLIEKISNNSVLSSRLQELILTESSLKSQILDLNDKTTNNEIRLSEHFKSQINNLSSDFSAASSDVNSLSQIIKQVQTNIAINQASISELAKKLDGLTIQEYLLTTERSLISAKATKAKLAADLIEFKRNILIAEDARKANKEQIQSLEQQCEILKSNENFNIVTNYFNENLSEVSTDIHTLDEEHKICSTQIDFLKKQISDSQMEIEKLSALVGSNTKEKLKKIESDLTADRDMDEHSCSYYLNFLRLKLDIDYNSFTKDTLQILFNSKEQIIGSDLTNNRKLRDEYRKLEMFSENIIDFLQSERAKSELKTYQSEYEFYFNRVKNSFNDELDKTKHHLQLKVKEFFFETLINDLYKKIDPHPDFREIVFKADFDSDNPRLDVFVRNNNNKDTLIPNLYFSTAQINILSLSIFLASALHSKEYDCIFIDDPIQSMDSINILSTIDLLRSIVVNHNKQIILSTHDKNFHNLLKKKMPPELFKSKFLELTGFGIVGNNEDSTFTNKQLSGV